MNIVIVDKNEEEVKNLRYFLEFIDSDINRITEYTKIENLAADIDDGIAAADIYYICISGNMKSVIKTVVRIKEVNSLSQIVFTLSEPVFCEECYEVDHVYCMVKPYTEDSVKKSYEKAKKVLSETVKRTFSFSFGGKVHMVRFEDILYFEKDKRKVRMYHINGSVFEFYETMNSLISRLSNQFTRCHNSFVVNIMYISECSSGEIVMVNRRKIPVSRTYADVYKSVL